MLLYDRAFQQPLLEINLSNRIIWIHLSVELDA